MPVLVTSNYNDDLIKNEQGRMETPFSNYKSMGNVLDAQGQLQCNSLVSNPIWKIQTRPRFFAMDTRVLIQFA